MHLRRKEKGVKRYFLLVMMLMGFAVPASASQLNLDPYFAVGVSGMQADGGSTSANTPAGYMAMGTVLNWISPNLRTEFRFGYGGQLTAFSGDINVFASYLLKPSLEVTRELDIYALLGFTTMNITLAGVDSADTDLSYGLGVSYHIPNESMAITADWMQYHTATTSSLTSISGMNISGVSISLLF